MNYYISDTHFRHAKVLKFDSRPFFTIEEMEKELIENWNQAVTNNDAVYILGDFCWGKENDWLQILPQLKGHKVLIRGNHDLKNPSTKLKNMFQDIKDYKEITDNGRHIIMCHYPMMFYKGAYDKKTYMLCGHVHTTRENDFLNTWRTQLRKTKKASGDSCGNIINVGCMMPYMGYTPRTLDEILINMGWINGQ